jgi:hypothetical protein
VCEREREREREDYIVMTSWGGFFTAVLVGEKGL